MHTHILCKEELVLLPQKAIWWPAKKMLIVADLHLGKGMHFRKAGIALPLQSQQTDFVVLTQLLAMPNIEQVLFLGDLFHSYYNSQWELVGQLIQNHSQQRFILVKGNHDILHGNQYQRFGFEVVQQLHIPPFIFTHEPLAKPLDYNFYGHIHPGVRLQGKGKQSLKLPCFFFSAKYAVVPSFGQLTGLHIVHPKKGDAVFGIAEGKIIDLQSVIQPTPKGLR